MPHEMHGCVCSQYLISYNDAPDSEYKNPSELVVKDITDAGDGTYTFKVPDKLGALVTYHKHTPGDPVKENEKEASCTEEGNKEHWICEGCGKLFADEKAQKELSPEDVTIPPDRP